MTYNIVMCGELCAATPGDKQINTKYCILWYEFWLKDLTY